MSYFRISPFMHADKINEPILLIHGEMDNNSGTFPLQSRRMFHALKGHGATARLVMLPYESHGYRARESVMHVQAEMIDWFDTHVKNGPAEHYNPPQRPAGELLRSPAGRLPRLQGRRRGPEQSYQPLW